MYSHIWLCYYATFLLNYFMFILYVKKCTWNACAIIRLQLFKNLSKFYQLQVILYFFKLNLSSGSMVLYYAIVYNNFNHLWQHIYQNVTSSGISSSIVYKYNVQYKTLNKANAHGNKTRAHASILLPLSGAQSS